VCLTWRSLSRRRAGTRGTSELADSQGRVREVPASKAAAAEHACAADSRVAFGSSRAGDALPVRRLKCRGICHSYSAWLTPLSC
jgi:hypothetical protein